MCDPTCKIFISCMHFLWPLHFKFLVLNQWHAMNCFLFSSKLIHCIYLIVCFVCLNCLYIFLFALILLKSFWYNKKGEKNLVYFSILTCKFFKPMHSNRGSFMEIQKPVMFWSRFEKSVLSYQKGGDCCVCFDDDKPLKVWKTP